MFRWNGLSGAAALLLFSSVARAQVDVQVDASADQRPISPLIYGFNFASSAQIAQGGLTATRWGGNRTTRYNYLVDVDNTAADYYFENLPGCWNAGANWCANPPADPKESSGANAFLQAAEDENVVALFTVPTMGWVAKGPPRYAHPFDCSCTGAGQDGYDPFETACGNGLSGGQPIDCGPQTDTSVAIDPDWVKDWVTYIVGKFGPSNGQRIYALDNEPNLWSSTHRDMRKTRLGYDELWQRMRDYAVAILEADPTAEIAGPAEWGWPNYFCSDADQINLGCSASSPDRAAHGGTELVAWLLDRAREYEEQNGQRILHYLDLHYYPQGGSNPVRTRSLWDPTYVDPSWIGQTIRLVPRMRDWVANRYPGTKLAVSEFDFYDHNAAVGAVTYAEVLGIFAREGIDLATAWAPPAPNEAAFAAYRLFRNYDGNGSAFESTSVSCDVTGSGAMAFAAASSTRLTLVLANEGGPTSADITLDSFTAAPTARVFRHTGTGGAVDAAPDATVSGGRVSILLPSTSITLVEFLSDTPDPPDSGTGTGGTPGSGGTPGTGGSGGGTGGTLGSGGAGGAIATGGGGGTLGSGGTASDAGDDSSVGGMPGDAGLEDAASGDAEPDASAGGALNNTGGSGSGGVSNTGGSGSPSGGNGGTGGLGGAATGGALGTSGGPGADGGNAPASGDDGGCGCRIGGRLDTRTAPVLLSALVALALRRRRRPEFHNP